MKVRDEIKRYAKEEDKPALNWLLDRYHRESEWRMMSKVDFIGTYPNTKRRWIPSHVGQTMYDARKKDETD